MKQIQQLPIVIREMTRNDLDSYCTLFENIFSNPPWNEKWTISKISVDINKRMSKSSFIGIVTATGTKNVGFITGFRLWSFKKNVTLFYIDQLFVDNNFQGNGMGKRLLNEMTYQLKTIGVSHIVLLTKRNTAAEKFYRKNGYKRFLSPVQIKGKAVLYNKL
jgi:aminoglycoside 6'-N-acetyltransferase I